MSSCISLSLLLLWLTAVVNDKGAVEDSFSTSQLFSFSFSFITRQLCIGHGSYMRGKILKECGSCNTCIRNRQVPKIAFSPSYSYSFAIAAATQTNFTFKCQIAINTAQACRRSHIINCKHNIDPPLPQTKISILAVSSVSNFPYSRPVTNIPQKMAWRQV